MAVDLLQPVKFPLVIEGRGFGPDPFDHFHELTGPAVAGIVVQPVAVPVLLLIAASGDNVEGDPSAGQLVQGGQVPGSQGGGHKPGPVGYEVAQRFGPVGSVSRHRETFRSGRRVSDQNLVEAAVLVGLGEFGDVFRVYACGDFVGGVYAAAEEANGNSPGGVSLLIDPDHTDDLDFRHALPRNRRRFARDPLIKIQRGPTPCQRRKPGGHGPHCMEGRDPANRQSPNEETSRPTPERPKPRRAFPAPSWPLSGWTRGDRTL